MPSEPLPWDRKEYFKARKEGMSEYVASEDSPKLPPTAAEDYGVLLNCLNMDSQLSHPSEKVLEDPNVLQFKKKFCSSSLFDENSNGNNPVFCSPKDLTLDVSANILAERWCNASDSDPFGTPCQEPTSVSDWKLDQNFSKDSPHRSCPGSNDYPVGLDYKPIRLMHTGRFSSYESGLSGSSSSKSNSVDFSNSRDELPKQSSCLSASGDTIACATPTTPSEEMSPWKRPRLRWGEGLAKFEKKFSGPDDGPSKSETISCISAQVSDCASPVTPSSAACSFFTGSVDKPLRKTALVSDENCIAHTLLSESQMHLESSTPFKLEILDLSIITHAVPSLIKMIKSQCSEDFSSTSCSVMSKLLFLKSEILKTIDMTESHVELLENELKSFNNEPGQNDCRCEASDTEVTETSGKAGEGNSEMSFNPALSLYAPAEVSVVKAPVDNGNGMKADMDNPETVTSKQVEPSPFASPHPENGMTNNADHFFYLAANHFSQEVQKTAKITFQAGKMNNLCVNDNVSSEIGCHMAVDERLIDSIWTSNRECANKTSVDFSMVFPVAETVQRNNSDGCSKEFFLQDLIVRKKRFLRFKEQAVTLKWRTLHSSWKDDMRLLSVRNHRLKAEKQWEIFLRATLNNQPMFRSKHLHVKNPSLDMGKFLSISNTKKLCRSVLKMPALILDDDDRRTSRFLSCNRLVDDPCAAEKERSMVNAWTSEERNIFMDKLASHGKDFRKIASFLEHKTTADCVEFYYKNHKSGSFMKTFKQKDKRKLVKSLFNNTYLVAPSKKCDRNMDTASLHILGAASELVARNSESKEEYKKRNFYGFLKHDVCRNVRKEGFFPISPSNFRFAEKELGTAGNESGACGSVSSEAISSCITSSVNQGEGNCNGTPKTFSIISNRHSVLDRQIDDEETCSDESSCELDVAFWTDREKSVFVRAVKSYGKDFSMVSRCIRTKSKDQCKSFYSKARMCLGLDIIHPDNEQQSVINCSIGEDGTPTLISTPEAVTDTGFDEVSQRIDEDMSLSASVMSSVDLLSPGAGFRFRALHYKLEGKEGKVEVPFGDLIVRRRSVDKSVSNHDKSEDSQAFLCEVSESAKPSVALSHSLPSTVPYFRSSAQAPLLQNHSGENSTSSDRIPNNDSYFIEDPGTPRAPCQGPADSRPLIGYTAAIPPLMNISNGSVRDETSQDCSAHHASFGLSNSAPRYAAALPTPEIPFVKTLFGGRQGHFQRPHWPGNHLLHQAYASSDKFYASKNLRKRENNGSGGNLNFEDSTISGGSNSDSKNMLPPYASIPQRCYIRRCNNLNSNYASSDVPNFTRSTSKHLSRNKAINPMDPGKQGKQSNLKLFGQVLIPSSPAPEPHHSPHSVSENKFTEIAQWHGTLFDVRPSDYCNRFLGHENIPVRSSWDDRLMQAAPLLHHCPNGMSTSSILDRQLIETTAVPNVNAPLNAAPISGNILHRSMMSHHSHTPIARHDL